MNQRHSQKEVFGEIFGKLQGCGYFMQKKLPSVCNLRRFDKKSTKLLFCKKIASVQKIRRACFFKSPLATPLSYAFS